MSLPVEQIRETLRLEGASLARFQSKVVQGDGCWTWAGTIDQDGYGSFSLGSRGHRRAHRLSYEHFVGPIPEGLTIDHLCRNRACVNPAHMEPVTNRENVLRGEGITAELARQTACKHGHEFTPENTYLWRGKRICRACRDATRRRFNDLHPGRGNGYVRSYRARKRGSR